MKTQRIVILALLISLMSSKILKIPIKSHISIQERKQLSFFFKKFSTHSNLNSFLKQNKEKSKFLSKHTNTIKKYWRMYQKHVQRNIAIQNNQVSDPLQNGADYFYYGEVQVGTPPQKFLVDFDTGSSDFYILGSNCPSPICKANPSYNPSRSSTSHYQGLSLNNTYADGSNSIGFSYLDTLQIGGVSLDNYEFFSLTQYTGTLSTISGLFGIGFEDNSSNREKSLTNRLLGAGIITEQSYSTYFTSSQNQDGSYIIFGGFDPQLLGAAFQYFPLLAHNPQKWFRLQLSSINIDGEIIPAREAVLDTGSTGIYGDPTVMHQVDTILDNYFRSGACSFAQLPVINFIFGGTSFPIYPKNYSFGNCQNIFSSYPGFDFIILGDAFLNGYVTLFDQTNARVGLAPALYH